jgi:lactoylglutathione lyase
MIDMKPIALFAAAMMSSASSATGPAGTASLPAFDHVAINVSNQQRSVDFYAGAFGMREIAAPFPPGGPRWMELAAGISLHIQALAEKPAPPPRSIHFAIAVADLAPVIAFLDAREMLWTDAQGRSGKVQDTRTDKVRQIYVRDPDGYWVEVNDKLKER